MAVQLVTPDDTTDTLLAQLATARQKRLAAIRSATPQTAANISKLSSAYPHLRPGVITALAGGGFAPNSSVAQAAAKYATAQPTAAKEMDEQGDDEGGLFGAIGGFVGGAKDALGDVAGLGARGLGNAADAGGNLLNDIPVVNSVQHGIGEGLEESRDVMGDVVKPVVRTGMIGLSAPLQEGQGLLRNLATGHTPSFQSDFAHMVKTKLSGDPVDTGSGWFIGEESRVAKVAAKSRREAGVIIEAPNGQTFIVDEDWLPEHLKAKAQTITPGRGIAAAASYIPAVGNYFDPGETGYNVLSGSADAFISLALDPANKAGAAFTKANKGRKSLVVATEAAENESRLRKGYNAAKAQLHLSNIDQADDVMARGNTLAATRPPRQVGDLTRVTGRQKPSAFGDRLYRELGSKEAVEGLLNDGGRTRPVWFANSEDLAKGQAKNKGIKIVLDTTDEKKSQSLLGSMSTDKPGWEFSAQKGIAEVQVESKSGSAIADNIMEATLDPRTASKAAVAKLDDYLGSYRKDLERIVDEDGVIRYQPKSAPVTVPSADEIMGEHGAYNGWRKGVDPDRANNWLTNEKSGLKVVDYLAKETNFERMRQITKGKVPVKELTKLVDAQNPDEVRQILKPLLGIQIENKFGVGLPQFQYRVKDTALARQLRIGQSLPTGAYGAIDIDDLDTGVESAVRWMQNAKFDPDSINTYAEQIARAEDRGQIFDVTMKMMKDASTKLVESGTDKKTADALTTGFINRLEDTRTYAIDRLGNDLDYMNTKVKGMEGGVDLDAFPTPQRLVDMLQNTVYLPDDFRAMRGELSKFKRVLQAPGVRHSLAATDLIQNRVWKRLALFRGAYTVRIVAEEQIRMAAADLHSFGNHPFSQAAWVMGTPTRAADELSDPNALKRMLSVIGLKEQRQKFAEKVGGRGANDIFGESFGDQLEGAVDDVGNEIHDSATPFAKSLARGYMGFISPTTTQRAKNWVKIRPNEQGYVEGWANQLLRTRFDPIQHRVVSGVLKGDELMNPELTGLDATKDWLVNGGGRPYLEKLAARDGLDNLLEPEIANGYVDFLLEHKNTLTLGDTALEEALKTGKLNGKAIASNGQPSKELIRHLDGMVADEAVQTPKAVIGNQLLTTGKMSETAIKEMDNAFKYLFSMLATHPTNKLSRSPTFRQYYWKKVSDLIPYMDDLGRDGIIANAKAAKMPQEYMDELIARSKQVAPNRVGSRGGKYGLTARELDEAAKTQALDKTRNLLYDLSDRGQVFDVLRIVFPFGEAWKEVVTRWAGLLTENPRMIRKGQQIIEGARGTGDKETGFFYTDPQTGEEMFSYPGSRAASKFLTGVPVPIAGSVKSLNVFTSNVIPGVGPVLQTVVANAIPDKPSFDWMRDAILPYGSPTEDPTSVGGMIEGLTPAWARKFTKMLQGPESDRRFLSVQQDAANYLLSTGKYSMNSPEDIAELESAATSTARKLFLTQSLAQFFGPAAPMFKWESAIPRRSGAMEVETGEGKKVVLSDQETGAYLTAFTLSEDYRKLYEADPQNATATFLAIYGENALQYTVPKSRGNFFPTDELHSYVRENGKIASKYPKVYGFFAPNGEDYSMTEAERQHLTGERKPLTLRERLDIANGKIASLRYRVAKEQMGIAPGKRANPEQSAWLKQYQQALIAQYPGYNPFGFFEAKSDQAETLNQLIAASKDKEIKETDGGQALNAYLKARTQAQKAAADQGLSLTGGSPKIEHLVSWLEQNGEMLAVEYPEFSQMWDRVFREELGL